MILVVGISTSIKVLARNDQKNISYIYADYYYDYRNIDNMIDTFEYCFRGVIIENIGVSQFNGNGVDIPYTYFKVRVTEAIKGMVNPEVIIQYYGGYNEENELILLEDAVYPKVGDKYTFYCIKTSTSLREDGRTVDGSYTISCPYWLVREKDKPLQTEVNKSVASAKKLFMANSVYSWEPLLARRTMPSDDGNLSFDEAYYLDVNSVWEIELRGQTARYWKYRPSRAGYLAIYTRREDFQGIDTVATVYLYDEDEDEYYFIAYNDDVRGHGYEYTDYYNFYCSFFAERNRTYYFEINTYWDETDTTSLYLIEDNYFDSDYSSLVKREDCVDSGRKIHFTNSTSYETDILAGAAEWNKLSYVQILPDTSSTINDLNITQLNFGDNNVIATTSSGSTWRILINTYYFNIMNSIEKKKTVMHEFGHCLGFTEFKGTGYSESYDNVMVPGRRELERLGPADVAVYRLRWG